MENLKQLHENSISRLINDANRLTTNLLQRKFKTAGYDITLEQMRILVHLWMEDGQTQQALSDLMTKDKANITRSIHALEKRNIVVRIPNREDRRSKRVHLTPKGKELEHVLVPMVKNILDAAEADISSVEILSCKSTLTKFINNLTASFSSE